MQKDEADQDTGPWQVGAEPASREYGKSMHRRRANADHGLLLIVREGLFVMTEL